MEVTGITVEKAQEIEDASVVSGYIAPGTGHLILVTAGGTEVDAGLVVPPIDTGETPTDVQIFTASGTWTKPANAQAVEVFLIGGGGGGASGARSTPDVFGGGGGGGAAVSKRTFRASDLTATVAVTIGAGGTGGTAPGADTAVVNAGNPGGTTTFGTYLQATGGFGGPSPSSSVPSKGGVVGTNPGYPGGMPSIAAPGGEGRPNASDAPVLVNGSNGWTGAGGAPSGGAGGAGSTTASRHLGGNGGLSWATTAAGGAGAAASGAAGGAGNASAVQGPGTGGGGGGGRNGGGAAGSGGAGGNYGAGGGGGGSNIAGQVAGSGGPGAQGIAVVVTQF